MSARAAFVGLVLLTVMLAGLTAVMRAVPASLAAPRIESVPEIDITPTQTAEVSPRHACPRSPGSAVAFRMQPLAH